jgi:hypothetical protein
MEVTRTESTAELATRLLREEFAKADAVSRHNTLLERGGQGQGSLPERRRWAEAWQPLELGRLLAWPPVWSVMRVSL